MDGAAYSGVRGRFETERARGYGVRSSGVYDIIVRDRCNIKSVVALASERVGKAHLSRRRLGPRT